MLNKITAGFLLLAILAYSASVAVGDPYVYIFGFVFLVLAVLFGLLVLAINLMWRLFPSRLKNTYEIKRSRFNTTILLSVPLAFIVTDVINDEYLAGSAGLIVMLGNAGILVFAVFVAWSFIRCSRWRTIFAGSGIFVIFIALLSFAGSVVPKSSNVANTDSIEKLKTLGYVDWVPVETEDASGKIKAGVTVYDPNLAFDGLNLYNSWGTPEAYLIDMRGNVVHKWTYKTEEAEFGGHVEMCKNGDLFVMNGDRMLALLDWESNVRWRTKIHVHHDIYVDENRQLLVLAREDALVFWHGIPVPVPVDYIAFLSSAGKVEKKVYFYEQVVENITLQRVGRIYRWVLRPKKLKRIFRERAKGSSLFQSGRCFDITHTNSIQVTDRDIPGFCRKGDWLISIREFNLVAVFAPEKQEFTWQWGSGEVQRQHHPTLLENGNILIFDNGWDRGFSRIVELDPLTQKIVWEYKAQPPEEFFSIRRGGCQRLPNGNTLITESEKGRVFEVTKEGEVVWEFYNPDIKVEDKKGRKGKKRKKDEERAVIYRMTRITYPMKFQRSDLKEETKFTEGSRLGG